MERSNKKIMDEHLPELAEIMTAAEISRHLNIPDATIRDNLMRLGIEAQRISVKKEKVQRVSYRGYKIQRTATGYTIGDSGVLYISEEVAKKCIDVYLERTKHLPIKQK